MKAIWLSSNVFETTNMNITKRCALPVTSTSLTSFVMFTIELHLLSKRRSRQKTIWRQSCAETNDEPKKASVAPNGFLICFRTPKRIESSSCGRSMAANQTRPVCDWKPYSSFANASDSRRRVGASLCEGRNSQHLGKRLRFARSRSVETMRGTVVKRKPRSFVERCRGHSLFVNRAVN
jgi:hypothetical protein